MSGKVDSLTDEEQVYFSTILEPKMKKLLTPIPKSKRTGNAVSLFNYYNGYPKEIVIEALSVLTDEELEIIRTKFGSDYESGVRGALSKGDSVKFNNTITKKILSVLMEKQAAGEIAKKAAEVIPVKNIQEPAPTSGKKYNIYEYFIGYSKEQIISALKLLTEEELKIVRSKFGSDLQSGERGTLSRKEYPKFRAIDIKLRKILDGTYVERKKSSQPLKKMYSLYDYFSMYSEEQILLALTYLKEDELELIKKKYGNDYKSGLRGSLTEIEARKMNQSILPKLRRGLEGKLAQKEKEAKETRSLYKDFSGYEREEIDRILTLLSDEFIMILKKRYGEDYLTYQRGTLSPSEQRKLNKRILPMMTKMLSGEEIDISSKTPSPKKQPKLYSLFDFFEDYEKEKILEALAVLSQDELAIIQKKYGMDFISGRAGALDKSEYNKFTRTIVPKIKSKLTGVTQDMKASIVKSEKKMLRTTKSRKSKTYSLFEYLSEYTEEQLLAVLPLMPDNEIKIIQKKYGLDYKSGQEGALTSREYRMFIATIIPRLKRKLNGTDNVRKVRKTMNEQGKVSLFVYFSEYEKEKILEALSVLDEAELTLIKKKYGEDYDSGEPGVLTKLETEKFLKVISKKILDKLNGVERIVQSPPKPKEPKQPVVYSIFSYFEGYSEEEILNALESLSSDDLLIIKKKFGDDYKSGVRGALSKEENAKFFRTISKRIKKNLTVSDVVDIAPKVISSKNKKTYSIFEYFSDYSESQIIEVLSVLSSDDLMIVKKKYGEDYKSGVRGALTKEENNRLFQIIVPKLRSKLDNGLPKDKIKPKTVASKPKRKYSLFDSFTDFSEEEVIEALAILSPTEISLLKKKYGDDYKSGVRGTLDKSETNKLFQQILPKLKSRLSGEYVPKEPKSKKVPVPKEKRQYSLFDVMADSSEEEVLQAISNLSINEVELLQKKYGEDYKSGVRGGLDKDASIIVYNRIIPKIRKYIKTSTSVNIEREEDDFFGGMPITSSDTFTKEDFITFRDYINRDEFKSAVKTLDFEDSILTTLALLQINGKTIPFSVLATLYDIEESELREILKRGLLKLKETFDSKVDEAGYEYVKKWEDVV